MDEQVTGPFRRWHHTHTFEPAHDGAATLMTDVVDFAAPCRPWARSPRSWSSSVT
ncbi:hypothetical protein ACFQQB_70140 [Nonomuraea rubra]|uniref:hypothetical protein n=1 Tax=Nonomuraea rubra TaxID=46180 RepID=UPI003613BEDC